MKSIVVPADNKQLDVVQSFIEAELEVADASPKAMMQVDMAVEEIFVNISSYAYHPEVGEAEIRCSIEEDPVRVIIQFLDHGVPFDPLKKKDAGISADEILEREGGLGILMVKKTMDEVSYSYHDGKNILTIMKTL